ncbi:MAG: metallophosphoesterase [Kiritimatiellae bacterium]|nr:metallophosphoesterase [Kiritimatiellia bacterium]
MATSFFLDSKKGRLRLSVPGLKEEVRVCFAGDTHLGLHDARDDANAENYARMARGGGNPKAFSATLEKAKSDNADLLALAGDIVSFPTLANVEFVSGELKKSGLDWMYTAGNHDWHFEGDAGSDVEQRAEWTKKRLKPFYPPGVDHLAYSKVVKGVRFVAIDNSIYHVSARQLEFRRAEAAKGDPVVLMMHVPFWVDGMDIETCGNPAWGAATDRYWQTERREKWAERQSAESFALREEVLSTPNLVAVLTGHLHAGRQAVERDKFLLTVPWNHDGYCWDIRLVPELSAISA